MPEQTREALKRIVQSVRKANGTSEGEGQQPPEDGADQAAPGQAGPRVGRHEPAQHQGGHDPHQGEGQGPAPQALGGLVGPRAEPFEGPGQARPVGRRRPEQEDERTEAEPGSQVGDPLQGRPRVEVVGEQPAELVGHLAHHPRFR